MNQGRLGVFLESFQSEAVLAPKAATESYRRDNHKEGQPQQDGYIDMSQYPCKRIPSAGQGMY